jgi:hypothetical protein
MPQPSKDQVTMIYIGALALFGVVLIAFAIGLLYWLVPG